MASASMSIAIMFSPASRSTMRPVIVLDRAAKQQKRKSQIRSRITLIIIKHQAEKWYGYRNPEAIMQSKYLCKEMAYIPLKYNTFMPFSLHNIRNPVLIEIMLFIFHNYNGQLANKIMEMFLCKKKNLQSRS